MVGLSLSDVVRVPFEPAARPLSLFSPGPTRIRLSLWGRRVPQLGASPTINYPRSPFSFIR